MANYLVLSRDGNGHLPKLGQDAEISIIPDPMGSNKTKLSIEFTVDSRLSVKTNPTGAVPNGEYWIELTGNGKIDMIGATLTIPATPGKMMLKIMSGTDVKTPGTTGIGT